MLTLSTKALTEPPVASVWVAYTLNCICFLLSYLSNFSYFELENYRPNTNIQTNTVTDMLMLS